MLCNICKINNNRVVNKIEYILSINDGTLPERSKRELCEEFPEYSKEINAINAQDCEIHFNFHQSASREPSHFQLIDGANDDAAGAERNGASITEDIGKDEAEVLYEMLNKQSATFNLLSTKINKSLLAVADEELSGMAVNPTTIDLYREITSSIRLTVKEIRELNEAVNGKKNNAFEGLRALAIALTPVETDEPKKDMTTERYDY